MDSVPDVRRAAASAAIRPAGARSAPPDGSRERGSGAAGRSAPSARGADHLQADQADQADGPGERTARAFRAMDPRATSDRGERMDALRQGLEQLARGGDAKAAALLEQLFGSRPGPGFAELLVALRANGTGTADRQLLLVASAVVAGAGAGPEAAARELLRELGSTAPTASAVAEVLRAAREAVASVTVGRSLPTLGAVRNALEAARSSLAHELAGTAEGAHPASHRLDGPLLRLLLGSEADSRPGHVAQLVLDVALAAPEALAPSARMLLEASRADGPLRDLFSAHLGAAEFEHAWSAARREAGEAPLWSFAVPGNGGAHTTVHLRREAPKRESSADQEGAAFRLSLGVDFSGLGPVRAEVTLRPGRIAVRLLVSRPATAQTLRRRAQALQTLLGAENRQVLLAVADSVDQGDVRDGASVVAPSPSRVPAPGRRDDDGTMSALMDVEG